MNYYFTITRMAMIKKTDDNTGEDVGKLEPSCTASIKALKMVCQFLKRLNIKLNMT